MAPPKISPVMAITGDEEFLRHRDVAATLAAQQKSGWQIEIVDGLIAGALENALGTSNCFLEDPRTLVVVRYLEKDKDKERAKVMEKVVSLLQEHLDTKATDLVVLLDYEGNPRGNSKLGKLIQGLGKWHRSFVVPDKEHKKKEVAIDFCREEAKRRGKGLPEGIAAQMIDRLGTDLGFLSFEVLKAVTLAEVEGTAEITLEQVKGSMAPLNTSESIIVADALLQKNAAQVFLTLRRVRKSSKEDPTIQVSQQLGGIILGWTEVAALRDQGKSVEDIVGLLGKNDWYVRNKLLPSLQRWTVSDLVQLIQTCSSAQQAQRNGSISPWTYLTARLVGVCRGIR